MHTDAVRVEVDASGNGKILEGEGLTLPHGGFSEEDFRAAAIEYVGTSDLRASAS
jgi:hypothetical protein